MARPPLGDPRRPLKIVTIGSSVSTMVVPARTSREESSYSEWFPELLAEHGIAAESRIHAQWYGLVRDILKRYERIRDDHPDVLVINLGMGEAQPNVVPLWLSRHLTSWNIGTTRWGRWYRRKIVPPVWKKARAWQRFSAPRVGLWGSRLPPARFVYMMKRLIGMTFRAERPLIIVLDIDPVNKGLNYHIPGLQPRVDSYNKYLVDIVSSFGEDGIVLLNTSDVVKKIGIDECLPDGLHRNAEAHEGVAHMIVDEILNHREFLGL